MQIINEKKAESLAAVIIAVFILSIALMWIINVVSFSKETSLGYESEIYKHILRSNSDNLVKKLDSSGLWKSENFYIYKDVASKEFRILTWSLNNEYKYIDLLWNKITNSDDNIWKIYKREFIHQSDILKHRIDPPEIPNLVFHFDANDPNGDNIPPADGISISTWRDLANGHDAVGWSPTYIQNWINWHPYIKFDGINDVLDIPTHEDINNNGNNYAEVVFKEKSFSIVLKTWTDVNSTQVIYEQWGQATGYSFTIHNWSIYAWIHNKSNASYSNTDFSSSDSNYYFERDSGHQFKSVELDEALPETVYYITIVQDSTHSKNGVFLDNMNKLQIFLNGSLVSETDHVDPQPEHHKIWIWAVNEYTVYPWNNATETCFECSYFKWWIWEFMSWNYALSQAEVRGIHNYLLEKWLGWKQSVEYSVINTDIDKYISN